MYDTQPTTTLIAVANESAHPFPQTGGSRYDPVPQKKRVYTSNSCPP
jgi:hypothetical protein